MGSNKSAARTKITLTTTTNKTEPVIRRGEKKIRMKIMSNARRKKKVLISHQKLL